MKNQQNYFQSYIQSELLPVALSVVLSTMLAFAVPNVAFAQFDVAQPAQTQTQRLPDQREAQQFKENYVEIDFGIFLHSGANNNEYTRLARTMATDIFAANGRDDLDANNANTSFEEIGYFRLAYGTHVNQKFSFEFATTGIAIANTITFDDDGDNPLDNPFGDVSNYGINIFEIAGIYYIPISGDFKFTLRAGFGFYDWFDEDSQPIVEEKEGQKFSGDTAVLGIGADISNMHLEYRTYNVAATDVYKTEKYQLYDTVGVFTVGYKFRF